MGRRDHPRCTNGIRFEFAKRLSAMTGKEPKEPRKPEALMMPQHSGLSKAPEIWRSSRLPPKSRLGSADPRVRAPISDHSRETTSTELISCPRPVLQACLMSARPRGNVHMATDIAQYR